MENAFETVNENIRRNGISNSRTVATFKVFFFTYNFLGPNLFLSTLLSGKFTFCSSRRSQQTP